MKKACFVVQRYGLEVNGGAELLTRQLAELMKEDFIIHVLTTKAIDYLSWKNEYTEDVEYINGIRVIRFPVEHERDIDVFNEINGRFLNGTMSETEEDEWIDKQGPYVPRLVDYINENRDRYDVFVFFTYLYYTSVRGMKGVAEKSVFVPFAHNEPFLRMRSYDELFRLPKAIIYQTEEERDLVQSRTGNYTIPYTYGGAGVTLPDRIDGERFKRKYSLDSYIVYVGRIDEGKNCRELFDFFIRYKKTHDDGLKLVLMGKPVIDIPGHKDIISLGFVSDEDKFDGIAGSELLVLPSKFESLSIVVLEAFSLNVPVLVNGECAVVKGHCEKSGGGFWYNTYYGFQSKLDLLHKNADVRKKLGSLGSAYVSSNYQWDIIREKMKNIMNFVISCSLHDWLGEGLK